MLRASRSTTNGKKIEASTVDSKLVARYRGRDLIFFDNIVELRDQINCALKPSEVIKKMTIDPSAHRRQFLQSVN